MADMRPSGTGGPGNGGKSLTTPRLLHPDQREAYVKIAERLYSSYARDPSGPDPRVFFTAAVAVLLHYPLEVAAQVNDPFWGLPGKSPHLPTPYDIKQFLESLMRPIREKAAWDQRCKEQIADSRKAKEGVRQSMEEIEDEMAKRGIFLPGYIKRSGQIPGRNYETPETVRRKLGLTQEQWDALPDDTARGGARWKPMK